MKQYIDKSALVAEIERLRMHGVSIFNEYDQGFSEGRHSTFEDILFFLNTLEVKEVDLKQEITQFLDTYFPNVGIGHKLSLRRTARHFYELGLKAKGE